MNWLPQCILPDGRQVCDDRLAKAESFRSRGRLPAVAAARSPEAKSPKLYLQTFIIMLIFEPFGRIGYA